ncbi:MAG: nucleotidyl transferase AbiEii/AbiGii toxin family protein [Mollicutes bacterium]|nr:nucleotidyl transferase AbiEii/AbiGii toxin family protein [Mollicutes bacterium]
MFLYTKKEIIITAQELNVQKQTLERVLRLMDVLEFINTDSYLKNKLALKGGTAINLTFYNYMRLSVDIDLDYIGPNDREQMMIDRNLIEKRLLNYTQESNMQYRNDKTKKTHALDSFVFNYSNLFNATDIIKIEINYMNRIHLFDCEKRNITLPLKNSKKVLTLNKIDLFASKTNALIYRTTIRDIYDVYNMIKNKTISSNEFIIFKKSLIFYLLLSAEEKINIKILFEECKKRMNSFVGKRVPQYLTSTLKLNEKFDISSAIHDISLLLDKILESITDNEIDFINSFPNISTSLFENKMIDEKINNHPMVKWKQSLLK